MRELIDIYFFWWFIPICILISIYVYYDMFLFDQRKPKYKIDENGYVKFYYRRFSCWEYFPIWKDNDEEREVKVFDKIRNIDYILSYIGPGRAKWKLILDNDNPISQNYITDYIRKLYPEFKTSEQLWQLHNLYINKENIILNKLIKNHIFKAYESNT